MFPHAFQIKETAGKKGIRNSDPLWEEKKKEKLMWLEHALGKAERFCGDPTKQW